MSQNKITNWFIFDNDKTKDSDNTLETIKYKYFYMKWYSGSTPSVCNWTNIKPVKYNYHKKITMTHK